MKPLDYAKTLEVSSRKALDDELDRMVEDAIRHSLAHSGDGILVTRHNESTFTIEISNEVPHGTITERDLTRS